MRVDSETNKIYIRQSWLGDYILCPQRSRYGMVLPSMRRGSDATAIGTGVHAGIEMVLNGTLPETDFGLFREAVHTSVNSELGKDIKHTGISADPEKMEACIDSMCEAWWEQINPFVTKGGHTEYRFKSPTGMTSKNGMEIWFEGTIDYVAPDGVLWDWKTASRPYYGKEKQKQSHQPTVYIDAMRTLGVIADTDEPTLFRFGVMVRQEKPKAQIITVSRGKEQVEWVRRQTRSVVNSALGSWGTEDWAMNDTSALCSSKWCDYWNICKGAHWSESSLELPPQSVTSVTLDNR